MIIGQIAQKQFGVRAGDRTRDGPGARRLLLRAGPAHVSPTQRAIEILSARSSRSAHEASMYVMVAGGGKVGSNLARPLIAKGTR